MIGRSRSLLAFLLVPALLYIYLPTFAWLGREWLGAGPFAGQARDWAHGPLVVTLIGYLLWRRREEFSLSGASLWGLPLVLGGVGLRLVGSSLGAPYLSGYSLIPIGLGLGTLFFGTRAGYSLLIPMLLFVLAVPFPADQWGVTGFLARLVAIASAFLSRLAGTPVSRSGQVITVGDAQYWLVPLCSGFNLIMALLALVVPLLYLRGASLKSQGAALLWLPALGLTTKIILVSIVITLTPRLGQDTALLLYHRWLGIPFYLASLGIASLLVTRVSMKARPPGGGLCPAQPNSA